MMGKDESHIPPVWPINLSTKYNITTPLKIDFDDEVKFNTYLSVSGYEISSHLKPVSRVN